MWPALQLNGAAAARQADAQMLIKLMPGFIKFSVAKLTRFARLPWLIKKCASNSKKKKIQRENKNEKYAQWQQANKTQKRTKNNAEKY